jgi:hypothetical protein
MQEFGWTRFQGADSDVIAHGFYHPVCRKSGFGILQGGPLQYLVS